MSENQEHDDGAADRRQVQMFITAVAGYVAEKARERQEQSARAAAESVEKQRVVEAQLAAERAAARAVWEPTLQPGWWSQATVEDVQRAYQAAAEWAPFDEDAAHAAEAIAQRVDARDVKVDQTPAPEPVESVEAIAQTRNLAPEEAADTRNAEWDSSERRAVSSAQAAAQYRAAGFADSFVAQAVEAERVSDVGQARPAGDAVSVSSSRSLGRSSGSMPARQWTPRRAR